MKFWSYKGKLWYTCYHTFQNLQFLVKNFHPWHERQIMIDLMVYRKDNKMYSNFRIFNAPVNLTFHYFLWKVNYHPTFQKIFKSRFFTTNESCIPLLVWKVNHDRTLFGYIKENTTIRCELKVVLKIVKRYKFSMGGERRGRMKGMSSRCSLQRDDVLTIKIFY